MVFPGDRASTSSGINKDSLTNKRSSADDLALAKELTSLIEQAAGYSDVGEGVTRLGLSRAHRHFLDWLQKLSSDCGYEFSIDHSGNARIKKYAVKASAGTLLFGGHQDSAINGCRHAGILGVLLPLLAFKNAQSLPVHIEIIALADGLGARFNSTLLSASVLAGNDIASSFKRIDDAGISYSNALKSFGCNPPRPDKWVLAKDRYLGFIEIDIEQHSMLQNMNLPVALVGSITGIERFSITVSHSTANSASRQDALTAAAGVIAWLDQLCEGMAQLEYVAGKWEVKPNTVNIAPKSVSMMVELRSPNPGVQAQVRQGFEEHLNAIPGLAYECVYSNQGVDCDQALTDKVGSAIAEVADAHHILFSAGAHACLELASVLPSTVLLLRAREDELCGWQVDEQDCAMSLAILKKIPQLCANDDR
ncbi:hypothetical protein [Halioxenophilus aromaticivorans]|uniref:Uncharacterized protein n=1 Tax=Halioxenophilus aromaticivorans TaxID=1306992 RepID=A0AAV3U020_9ALTE